ncbi:MAG TPA: metalloregulator ArsR/SmtB family transcription factor [Burkholderiales bacterium]|nr:metalloregulator ArsR/SmtB family transcription factor [Burkholderiales bacterium]
MEAARALGALGHETRLALFRILVQVGPSGVAAGEIARSLELAPNTLSFHLKELAHTGLIASRQEGRYLIYSANFPAMNALVSYLTENCCGGVSCAPLARPASRSGKPPIASKSLTRKPGRK